MTSVLNVVVLLSVLKYLRCTFFSITIVQAVSKHIPSFQAINVLCSFDVGLDHKIEQVRMHKSRKIVDWMRSGVESSMMYFVFGVCCSCRTVLSRLLMCTSDRYLLLLLMVSLVLRRMVQKCS